MKNYEELLKTDTFWLTTIQNDLFNAFNDYMKEKGLNRTQLATELGVSKGYITQIMNGDFDYKLSTYIKLVRAVDRIPNIKLQKTEEYLEEKKKPRRDFITVDAKIPDFVKIPVFIEPSPVDNKKYKFSY